MKLLVVGTGSIGKRHLGNFQRYFDICDIADNNKIELMNVKKIQSR